VKSLRKYFKTASGTTSEMPLTGRLLDRQEICPIQVDHILEAPNLPMDFGFGGSELYGVWVTL